MEALSLGIEEHGSRRPGLRDRAAGHRHVERLADPRAAGRDQRQRDRAAECGAPVARGDVAEHGIGGRLRRRWRRSARPPPAPRPGRSVSRPTSCLRSGRAQVGARPAALADEVGLRLGDDPAQAEIVGRHRAVGLLADDDVALLGAQHVHRLGAVGRDAVRLRRPPQRLPHRAAVVGRHVDLVAELAGEADAEDARRHAARPCLRARSCAGRPRATRSMSVDERRAARSRAFGPCTAIDGPLLGDRGAARPRGPATRSAGSPPARRARAPRRRSWSSRGSGRRARRAMTPSSKTMPSSRSIRP